MKRADNLRTLSGTAFIYTMSPFVGRLTVLLLIAFFLLVLATLVGFHQGTELLRPNLFADYEVIWPGQPATNLAEYVNQAAQGSMYCYGNDEHNSPVVHVSLSVEGAFDHQVTCMHRPMGRTFRWITVRLRDDQVQELALFSDTLQQDTLFLYWGAPDAIYQSGDEHLLNLYWDYATYSVMASVVKSSWVVKLVTLTAKA